MADTMQFDLVSPERNLLSVPVREVRLPGTEGDLTAMPGHALAIVNLRPGIVTVVAADGTETEFAVTGGFVEISNESVSLLAERGYPRGEMTQVVFTFDLTGADGLFAARSFRIVPGDTVVATESPVIAARTIMGLIGSAFSVVNSAEDVSQ